MILEPGCDFVSLSVVFVLLAEKDTSPNAAHAYSMTKTSRAHGAEHTCRGMLPRGTEGVDAMRSAAAKALQHRVQEQNMWSRESTGSEVTSNMHDAGLSMCFI